MAGKILIFVSIISIVVVAGYFAWKLTARGAYESAEYMVLVSDGSCELRQYPELTMATTSMRFDSQGGDGSFMRLFRYISGANDQDQKIAMTIPVFMESGARDSQGQMGFVVPKNVTQQGIPKPASDNVRIRKRVGGRYAVIRFAGRMNQESFADAEIELRDWMMDNDLAGDGDAEFAGYDPPWTPGPLRRNEVLIRLK
jgi:hypothetical protein